MQANDITRERLRRLAGIRAGEAKVLSLFLNLDPREFATAPARNTEVRSVLDRAARLIREDEALSHAARASLRADLERVQAELGGGMDARGAHGLAVFASSAADLFEVIKLSEPVDHDPVIADAPFIEPLSAIGPPERWCVLLVNRRMARLFCGPGAALEEVELIEDDLRRRHDQGGWSQANYQRSVEQEKLNHLGHALDTLFARFKRRPFDHLVVGAPDELVGEVEQKLHPYLRDRLAGRLHLDVENSTPEQVKAAAAEVVDAHVAGVEREALDRLKQGIGRGDRGVSGPAAVIEALEQARVDTLLLAEDFDAPELDEAVEKAITQSARIIVVRHHDDLIPHAGIGAVLRF